MTSYRRISRIHGKAIVALMKGCSRSSEVVVRRNLAQFVKPLVASIDMGSIVVGKATEKGNAIHFSYTRSCVTYPICVSRNCARCSSDFSALCRAQRIGR
jgi:hypothetical protein